MRSLGPSTVGVSSENTPLARLAKPIPDTLTLSDAVAAWERSLRAAVKSDRTIDAYLYATQKLAAHVGPDRPLDAITRTDHYGPSPDVQLKLSVNTNLDDTGRRTAVFKLFDEVAAAVDGQEASHVQMSLSVVVPEKKAERLTARAEAAGGTTSTTPLD